MRAAEARDIAVSHGLGMPHFNGLLEKQYALIRDVAERGGTRIYAEGRPVGVIENGDPRFAAFCGQLRADGYELAKDAWGNLVSIEW